MRNQIRCKHLEWKPKRFVILVDHANIFHNLLRLNKRIDYERLEQVLVPFSKGILIGKVIYMGVYKKILSKRQAFIAYLESIGWKVVTLPVKTTAKGKMEQKRIDLRMYRHGYGFVQENMCDTVIIVSGDGDLAELVIAVKELDKSIEVWSFQKSMAHSLIEEAGEENTHYLDTIMEQITISSPHGNENGNKRRKRKRRS